MLSDTEFEDKVRQAGCFPTLLQLGWMRWAFDLGVELASQPREPTGQPASQENLVVSHT